jgi:hypothetical protein
MAGVSAPQRSPAVADEIAALAEDLLDALSQPPIPAALALVALLLVLRLLLAS